MMTRITRITATGVAAASLAFGVMTASGVSAKSPDTPTIDPNTLEAKSPRRLHRRGAGWSLVQPPRRHGGELRRDDRPRRWHPRLDPQPIRLPGDPEQRGQLSSRRASLATIRRSIPSATEHPGARMRRLPVWRDRYRSSDRAGECLLPGPTAFALRAYRPRHISQASAGVPISAPVAQPVACYPAQVSPLVTGSSESGGGIRNVPRSSGTSGPARMVGRLPPHRMVWAVSEGR